MRTPSPPTVHSPVSQPPAPVRPRATPSTHAERPPPPNIRSSQPAPPRRDTHRRAARRCDSRPLRSSARARARSGRPPQRLRRRDPRRSSETAGHDSSHPPFFRRLSRVGPGRRPPIRHAHIRFIPTVPAVETRAVDHRLPTLNDVLTTDPARRLALWTKPARRHLPMPLGPCGEVERVRLAALRSCRISRGLFQRGIIGCCQPCRLSATSHARNHDDDTTKGDSDREKHESK
jgi:hypothetical protein